MILPRLAAAATFFACAFAQQLQILQPNGNDWWVAESNNVISWNCHQASTPTEFTILIANVNQNILTSPLAIISIEQNYQCSQLMTANQVSQTPAQGYTILFANPINSTQLYATSQPFEIRALGSAYPVTSSASPNASGTSTGSTASATTHSSADKLFVSLGATFAAVGAVFGLVVG
ncbi:hypothetical protein L208DRAFT_1374432 [Tricholoma matsutake]|nr:hypothetical protein L208DRAFT_1374432 [Tricholoma matsutake 945]